MREEKMSKEKAIHLTIYTSMHARYHVEAVGVCSVARAIGYSATLRDPSTNRDHSFSTVPAIVVAVDGAPVHVHNVRSHDDIDAAALFEDGGALAPAAIERYCKAEAKLQAGKEAERKRRQDEQTAAVKKMNMLKAAIESNDKLDPAVQAALLLLLNK